jgi:hypothetical protein
MLYNCIMFYMPVIEKGIQHNSQKKYEKMCAFIMHSIVGKFVVNENKHGMVNFFM